MGAGNRCEDCGAPLDDVAATRGLCARCLVRLAIDAKSDVPESGPESSDAEPAQAPERIGPYRIIRLLGEGGMGLVYLAEQTRPVRRAVAIKLIKAGLDTDQVVARFESERQALAMMDHPGIARVFDGGVTEQGRPYFAMELVEGEPITSYCDRHRSSTVERLELFARVCNAVHHAHQKGIIHRDIKPSNVLVTELDGSAMPKIIDFGVAKATRQPLTERTLLTRRGGMIGTPEYMSPEQTDLSGHDVDTRTDVYALGVLLYELLVGLLPFDPKEFRQGSLEELCRKIRVQEPPRPSVRLSTTEKARDDSSRRDDVDRKNLRRQLRGDLDWITMKALAKERERRYGSASEFAEDIRRHLDHVPVVAGPPSWRYRSGKFLRRHRLGVAAGALVLSALAAGLVGTSYGLLRATRAEEQALQAATSAETVSRFLIGLFDVLDPDKSRGETITAHEILDRGVEQIHEQFEGQPELRSRMLGTMGRVYSNLGLLDDADPLLDEAARLENSIPIMERVERNTRFLLAWNRLQLGRYDAAEQAYRAEYDERARELGEDHPLTARTLAALGNLYRIRGRNREAEQYLSRAIEIQLRQPDGEPYQTLIAKGNLAVVYSSQGRHGEAGKLLNEVVAGFRDMLGDNHENTLTTQRLMGDHLVSVQKYDEAERLLRDTLEAQRTVLGADHPRVQETLNSLAVALRMMERYPEARDLYLESLRVARAVRGDDHPEAFSSLGGVGETYRLEGRLEEAETVLVEALSGARSALGSEDVIVGWAALRLGLVYRAQARDGESNALLEEALSVFRVAVESGFPTSTLIDSPEFLVFRDSPEFRETFLEILTKGKENESNRTDGG